MSRLGNLLDAVTDQVRGTRVSPIDQIPAGSGDFGHAQDRFAPQEYERYIATSNDVYSAAMLKARSLAKLKLQYFDAPDGDGEQIEGGAEIGELLRRVNPFWTWRRLIVQYELSMSIWGQSYLFAERGPTLGTPTELWWAKPTQVVPVLDRENYIKRFDYQPYGGGEKISFDPAEVVWSRYPNIIDEFTGLAPLAAVRLAADVASASQKANMNLFDQGFVQPHIIGPPKDTEFTPEQALAFEKSLNDRFRGVNKAHRWSVFRYDFQTKEIGVSPSDAQFIEGMNLSFRQVCRGMGVPPALLADSEYATLSNLNVYERLLWDGTMEFEANFFTDELDEQLIPMFGGGSRAGGVKSIKFDFSNIAALQEDKTTKEERDKAQIGDGRVTINEWREENGKEAVPWGDVYWVSWNKVPIKSGEPEAGTKEPVSEEEEERARLARITAREKAFKKEEDELARIMRRIFARIFDAAQQTLRQKARTPEDAAEEPFKVARYVVAIREESRVVIDRTLLKAIVLGGKEAGIDIGEDLLANPKYVKQAEKIVNEMADQVATSTYNDVQKTIRAGIAKDETLDEMTDRIRRVVGQDAAEHRARRIAQTETTRTVTEGKIDGYREAGVKEKRWVTRGDADVRDTHAAVNGVKRKLAENFQVGSCAGPGPGKTGCPEEDINCRCDLAPVLKRSLVVPSGPNGYQADVESLETIRNVLASVTQETA